MPRFLCALQPCQYYRGVIRKSRDQAFYAEPKGAILQLLYRGKSCTGPLVYSKSVNITGALWGKIAIRRATLSQKMPYHRGCIGKSRAQAPLYTALCGQQGLYRQKWPPGPHCKLHFYRGFISKSDNQGLQAKLLVPLLQRIYRQKWQPGPAS